MAQLGEYLAFMKPWVPIPPTLYKPGVVVQG